VTLFAAWPLEVKRSADGKKLELVGKNGVVAELFSNDA
jgi:hypothetical protein